MRLIRGFALYAAAAAALAWAAAVPARAQATYNGPAGERARDENERDLEDRIAYQRLRAALAANRSERPRVDPQLALEQLQEDFTRLQLLNKELVLTSSRGNALDLKFVERSTAEIRRRAERLMSNLALPEPEDAPPGPRQEVA